MESTVTGQEETPHQGAGTQRVRQQQLTGACPWSRPHLSVSPGSCQQRQTVEGGRPGGRLYLPKGHVAPSATWGQLCKLCDCPSPAHVPGEGGRGWSPYPSRVWAPWLQRKLLLALAPP